MRHVLDDIHDLLDALRLRLDAVPEARDELLPHWPERSLSMLADETPAALPACAYLDTAIAAASTDPEIVIARTLQSLKGRLKWTYSYPKRNGLAADLGSRIAFTQIVGDKGLVHSKHILAGFTLLAPHTHYPLHRHPAVETYLVVSGTAVWTQDREEAARKAPGSVILHRSGVGHAMTSADEPLLAAFTWHGDIASPSTYD